MSGKRAFYLETTNFTLRCLPGRRTARVLNCYFNRFNSVTEMQHSQTYRALHCEMCERSFSSVTDETIYLKLQKWKVQRCTYDKNLKQRLQKQNSIVYTIHWILRFQERYLRT